MFHLSRPGGLQQDLPRLSIASNNIGRQLLIKTTIQNNVGRVIDIIKVFRNIGESRRVNERIANLFALKLGTLGFVPHKLHRFNAIK
jgi:hypothetical protein